jgi:hypothetical protein
MTRGRTVGTPADGTGAGCFHELLGELLLIDPIQHSLDRLRHDRSFPELRSACRTSYTLCRTVPQTQGGPGQVRVTPVTQRI